MSKISELSDGGSLVSSDYLIAVRSGGNVKVRMDQINVDQIDLGDNEFIRLGNSQDLTIVHDASNSIINQAGIGDLLIQKAGTTKASVTANGLEFPDSSKAIFGAGSDLQIYHSGSHSFISEAGTGDLYIGASNNIALMNAAFSENKLLATTDGALTLYHDGSAKLATTATGIDVTGNITVGTNDTILAENNIRFKSTGAAYIDHNTVGQAINFRLSNASSLDKTVMTLTSAGNVGIGVSTPSNNHANANNLVVGNGTSGGIANYVGTGTGWYAFSRANANNSDAYDGGISYDGSRNLKFHTNAGSERMRIDASGSVGIGTTSPNGNGILTLNTPTDNSPQIVFSENDTGKWLIGHRHDGDHFRFYDLANSAERMRIDSSGNVGIGATPEAWASGIVGVDIGTYGSLVDGTNVILSRNAYYDGAWKYKTTDHASSYWQDGGGQHIWQTAASGTADAALTWSESMRIDASNRLLVGKTASDYAVEGVEIRSNEVLITKSTTNPLNVRNGQDGGLIAFASGTSTVGGIGTSAGHLYVGNGDTNLIFNDTANSIYPWDSSANDVQDATVDLGASTARFKDLYRSGSTISTSDRNMKQDERDLTEAETRVAQACKGLLKAFRFIDAVQVDGDDARIHFGIIAQDLQAAFEAEGLDATKYAMFRPSTFTNDEGNEETRLGVCYENLLAFIIAAI